jgi:hypothetical protein
MSASCPLVVQDAVRMTSALQQLPTAQICTLKNLHIRQSSRVNIQNAKRSKQQEDTSNPPEVALERGLTSSADLERRARSQ